MEKKDIIQLFDKCAPWWDEDIILNEDLITTILDNGGIQGGIYVLDVVCGAGGLFPDYLKRNVASVTGIDLSPKMVKIAKDKFHEITVICSDVGTVEFTKKLMPLWSTIPFAFSRPCSSDRDPYSSCEARWKSVRCHGISGLH